MEPSATPTVTPLPAPRATKHPASLPVDGAFSLPGIWNCETLANSIATSIYTLVDRKHMTERTTLRLAGRAPVELDTAFTFDAKHKFWKLSMQKGAYSATAPVWSGDTWIFEGIELDAEPHRAVRLVYTSLGPDGFRSDFQALNRGSWQTFSGATCKRYIP